MTHIVCAGARHGVHTDKTPCLGIQPLTFVVSGDCTWFGLLALAQITDCCIGYITLVWLGLAWLGVHEPVWARLGLPWLCLACIERAWFGPGS